MPHLSGGWIMDYCTSWPLWGNNSGIFLGIDEPSVFSFPHLIRLYYSSNYPLPHILSLVLSSGYAAAGKVKSSKHPNSRKHFPPLFSSTVRTANIRTSIFQKVGRGGGAERGLLELLPKGSHLSVWFCLYPPSIKRGRGITSVCICQPRDSE